MPPSLNHVTLIGTLSSAPAVAQVDRTRIVTMTLSTLHGSAERTHRVVVADEFLARALHERLSPGTSVHILGELDYDADGAYVLVAGRRGSDVHVLSGDAVGPRPVPAARPEEPMRQPAAPASDSRQSPAAAPRPAPAPGGLGGLAGLAGLGTMREDHGDSPEDGPIPDQAAAAPRAPAAHGPGPAPVAPRPVPAAAPIVARTAPVARTPPGARPANAEPVRPPSSPHAVQQPRPTQPPLRPGQPPAKRDGFTPQVDDDDIPF